MLHVSPYGLIGTKANQYHFSPTGNGCDINNKNPDDNKVRDYVDELEPSCTAGEPSECAAALPNNLAVLPMVKHGVTIRVRPSDCTPRHILMKTENI